MPTDKAGLTALATLIMLAGCNSYAALEPTKEREKEARLSCYWPAEDHAKEPAIKAVLADGVLTETECREVVQPFADLDYARQIARARERAVLASKEPTNG